MDCSNPRKMTILRHIHSPMILLVSNPWNPGPFFGEGSDPPPGHPRAPMWTCPSIQYGIVNSHHFEKAMGV